MYLACTLLQNNICLEKKLSNKGPDIHAKIGNSTLWVEAIAPTGGDPNKPDSVIQPLMKPGEIIARQVPDEQIILRYRNAIHEKYECKYKHYLSRGIVSCSACYVIAVNGCQIHCSGSELDVPRIVRSVLPFGWPVVTINTKSHEVIETSYQYRPRINKVCGSSVDTDIFLNQSYKNISAILFSNIDVANHPVNLGEDFVCIHNPYACNPLPYNFLCVGTCYSVSTDNSTDNMILNRKYWQDIQ